MYITASETVNLSVEFKAPQGHLVVPDAGTFNYTVIRLDGTIVQSTQNPTLGATDTETVITLAAPTTDMFSSGDQDTLRVKYAFDLDGTTLYRTITLAIVPEPKFIVTEEDVRNVFGATELLLPDGTLNLYETYIHLKNGTDIGQVDLDAALIGGGYTAQLANDAIKYSAACAALDVMAVTLVKTHTEDNISITHFEADLKALKARLKGKYYDAIGVLNPALGSALQSVSDLFIVANPDPDVITGES